MNVVTKEQLVEELNKIENAYKDWKLVENKLNELMGGELFEGSLGQAVDGMAQSMVDLFCMASGIDYQAVGWWIYDADWGKSKFNYVVTDDDVTVPFSNNAEFIEWELFECL